MIEDRETNNIIEDLKIENYILGSEDRLNEFIEKDIIHVSNSTRECYLGFFLEPIIIRDFVKSSINRDKVLNTISRFELGIGDHSLFQKEHRVLTSAKLTPRQMAIIKSKGYQFKKKRIGFEYLLILDILMPNKVYHLVGRCDLINKTKNYIVEYKTVKSLFKNKPYDGHVRQLKTYNYIAYRTLSNKYRKGIMFYKEKFPFPFKTEKEVNPYRRFGLDFGDYTEKDEFGNKIDYMDIIKARVQGFINYVPKKHWLCRYCFSRNYCKLVLDSGGKLRRSVFDPMLEKFLKNMKQQRKILYG